ncbi:DUF3365 domain-containing protein [Pontibacter sp. SGAir0037]|uniref:c-type heme family protein n=1 Tax=Pontibacter sp. SGAir0037 TaxID=2571030 RepID=UPI001F0FA836|nr:DUF3365 domain-containing protein [Pontibacter sp. SGAir0037]
MLKKMFTRHKLLLYITLATTFIVSGCELKVKPIEGGKEIAKELERHKIKRVTEKDFLVAARTAGDSITRVAQRALDARLQVALQTNDIATAMAYCQPENYAAVDSLEQLYGAIARRTSSKLRNPQNKAAQSISDLVGQYERKERNESATLELSEEELLYTAPIFIRNESCLHCHGTPGKEILEADYALIKAKYPADEAVGYKTGELRGMWHITFDKKAFVTYLNAQPKKSWRKSK